MSRPSEKEGSAWSSLILDFIEEPESNDTGWRLAWWERASWLLWCWTKLPHIYLEFTTFEETVKMKTNSERYKADHVVIGFELYHVDHFSMEYWKKNLTWSSPRDMIKMKMNDCNPVKIPGIQTVKSHWERGGIGPVTLSGSLKYTIIL